MPSSYRTGSLRAPFPIHVEHAATVARLGVSPAHVLEGLRSLISEGWVWSELAKGLGAIGAVTIVSFGLASAAMRG